MALPFLWAFLTIVDSQSPQPSTTQSSLQSTITSASSIKEHVSNSSSTNSTTTHRGIFNSSFNVDSSMIQRALYVLIGITIIGVLYFLIRAVRLKKPTQRKKYGLLSNYDDSVEMADMESDEDETVYEARTLRRWVVASCSLFVVMHLEHRRSENIPSAYLSTVLVYLCFPYFHGPENWPGNLLSVLSYEEDWCTACIAVAKKKIFIVSKKTSKSRISKRTKPIGLIMMPKLLWRMQAV